MRKQAGKTLETRQKNYKLTLFFKMINGLFPQYLSDLAPATNDSSSNYNLRNSNIIHPVNVRTSLYYNSCLSSAVLDWNNIPDYHRNVDTVIAFKNFLSRDKPMRDVRKELLISIWRLQILSKFKSAHSMPSKNSPWLEMQSFNRCIHFLKASRNADLDTVIRY